MAHLYLYKPPLVWSPTAANLLTQPNSDGEQLHRQQNVAYLLMCYDEIYIFYQPITDHEGFSQWDMGEKHSNTKIRLSFTCKLHDSHHSLRIENPVLKLKLSFQNGSPVCWRTISVSHPHSFFSSIVSQLAMKVKIILGNDFSFRVFDKAVSTLQVVYDFPDKKLIFPDVF